MLSTYGQGWGRLQKPDYDYDYSYLSTMETILGFLYSMYTYGIIMHDWASYCAEVWECEQSNFHLAPRVVNKPGNKSISQGNGKYREILRNRKPMST